MKMILVTGASGAVGGRVARLYADPESLPSAFEDVDTAFIVSGYAEPGERWKLHANAVDAALAAGVGRIVYLSFQGAAPDSAFAFARDHARTEQHIRSKGIAYTLIRPNLYLDEVPHFFDDEGVVRGP